MHNDIILDTQYSTTKLITKEQPTIIPEIDDVFESMLFLPPDETRQGEGGLRKQGFFKKSYDDKPLITVITVVYNGEAYLEETILSVINQTYDNVEYIIIDGGSTDTTVDIINKYEDQIDYWVSEKDSGISDAFNKGIQMARGKYLNFLNAGDYYIEQNILKSLHSTFLQHHDVITTFVQFGDITIPKKILRNDDPLYVKSRISHQASFVKSTIFKKKGLYSHDYRLRMDYEYWMRILSQYQFYFIDRIIIQYAEDGISGSNMKRFYIEELSINKKYLSTIQHLIRTGQIIFTYIYKTLLK